MIQKDYHELYDEQIIARMGESCYDYNLRLLRLIAFMTRLIKEQYKDSQNYAYGRVFLEDVDKGRVFVHIPMCWIFFLFRSVSRMFIDSLIKEINFLVKPINTFQEAELSKEKFYNRISVVPCNVEYDEWVADTGEKMKKSDVFPTFNAIPYTITCIKYDEYTENVVCEIPAKMYYTLLNSYMPIPIEKMYIPKSIYTFKLAFALNKGMEECRTIKEWKDYFIISDKVNITQFVNRVFEYAKKELDKCSELSFDYTLIDDEEVSSKKIKNIKIRSRMSALYEERSSAKL